ncbi:unnamed protein product, partial [Cochlearia groenlandica]
VATRGLPGRSPILVLLSPKHAYLRSSDGIRCISAVLIKRPEKGSKRPNLGSEIALIFGTAIDTSALSLGAFRKGAVRDVVSYDAKVTAFQRVATRGLPGRSPILVLLSPKHAYLRSSDGIRCISAVLIKRPEKGSKRPNLGSEIAPIFGTAIDTSAISLGAFRKGAVRDVVSYDAKVTAFQRVATRGLPGRSPILVLLSPKHAYLRSSDGIRCISAVLIKRPGKGSKRPNLGSEIAPIFGTAIDTSALSLGAFRKGAVRDVVSYDAKVTAFQRSEVFSAQKAKTSKLKRKKGCNTRTSREVTHPSTTLAQARLSAEF